MLLQTFLASINISYLSKNFIVMKTFSKLLCLIILPLSFASCSEKTLNANDLFSLEIENIKTTYTNQDELTLKVTAIKGSSVDEVSFAVDDNAATTNSSISLKDTKMGRRRIRAFIKSDGNSYELEKVIKVVANTPPVLYSYKVLETYHHDIKAYTQGLEFHNDTLYESTGQYNQSSLRKTDYPTGKVLTKIDLANQYFGEGLTIMDDKVFQLTWRENTGFIYSLKELEKTGSFVYNESKEGWGLCNNGSKIFKSDGTEKIWTLNPDTLSEESYIEIYTNNSVIDNVNELEWVDGKIYANVYQRDAIAIVNPANGAVEGVIDLKGLQKMVTQHTTLDVLNGIAYKGEPNILYVTGKNWDKLFKIEIIPK
jgi:glutaminyl-peptide cyclotransferase